MKFPGSKLLHQWDLSLQKLSLDELFRSCRQAGLTGLAEVKFPDAVGLIFYYLGGEVNALYREGAMAYNGQSALDRLRTRVTGEVGTISVFELPLDMAHLLRGITNRQKLKETLRNGSDLVELLRRLEKSEHTGTLEVQTSDGSAMVLLVRGRASNVYWETTGGLTFEKGEARQKLEESLGQQEDVEVPLFLGEFSRDVWKNRHEVQVAVRSRLERRDEIQDRPTEEIASEETVLREQVLDELTTQLPSLILAFIFDLMTGSIYLRKGRGATDVHVAPLADRVPDLTISLRDQMGVADETDPLDFIELSTEKLSILVTIVSEAQEAIAIVADRSQPTALIAAALNQAVHGYAVRLHPARRKS
jgi:hypothetical protein